MISKSSLSSQSTIKQITSWVSLVLFVLSGTPLPIFYFEQNSKSAPLSRSENDVRSADANEDEIEEAPPYPCQGGLCGCRTARQCWTSCCCRTPAQRTAWAKARNIVPPDYAVLDSVANRDSQSDVQELDRHVSNRDCCKATKHSDDSLKPISNDEQETYCGQSKRVVSKSTEANVADANRKSRAKARSSHPFVSVIEAAKCQGISFDLTSLNTFISPPSPPELSWTSPVRERLLPKSYVFTSPALKVPHPPPEWAGFSS